MYNFRCNSYAGGLIGEIAEPESEINASFAVGDVGATATGSNKNYRWVYSNESLRKSSLGETSISGYSAKGGFVGLLSKGSINNSYRKDCQDSSVTNSIGIAISEDIFLTFDFFIKTLSWDQDTWILKDGYYPTLKNS